jgi:hypothetical protein
MHIYHIHLRNCPLLLELYTEALLKCLIAVLVHIDGLCWHQHYPCAAEIKVEYLCYPTVLLSSKNFHTVVSHLLVKYTDLLLSYRSCSLSMFGIGLCTSQYLHFWVLVSFSSLQTPLYKSTSVSTSLGFIFPHPPYPHQYHRYSYTPNYLFILTHSYIPCGTRLLTAIHSGDHHRESLV